MLPGFAPAGEVLLFRQKDPKPWTPRLASSEGTDANLGKADQLAEPVLSFVVGLKQGPPGNESVLPLASRQASCSGEDSTQIKRTFEINWNNYSKNVL